MELNHVEITSFPHYTEVNATGFSLFSRLCNFCQKSGFFFTHTGFRTKGHIQQATGVRNKGLQTQPGQRPRFFSMSVKMLCVYFPSVQSEKLIIFPGAYSGLLWLLLNFQLFLKCFFWCFSFPLRNSWKTQMQQEHSIYEVLLGLSLIERSNWGHDTITVRYFIKRRYIS